MYSFFSRCWENKARVSTIEQRLTIFGDQLSDLPSSATIEHLKGSPLVDKVAFFYCKRDEENRKDRHKILLSLIKQLVCHPGGPGIHAGALEAYEKERKDPSSRANLNLDSTLKLLAQVLECYVHPVLVLDALDECTQETRGFIFGDLHSILDKLKCPLKVLVASRYSLDIEDRLQNLSHVRIEAADNAQDIENYVRKELESRVSDRSLLRGKVSEDLIASIQEVLLRDAKGM